MKKFKNKSNQKTEVIERTKEATAKLPKEISIKKLFLKFEIAFLESDPAAIAECLSPAFEWRPPSGEVFVGKAAALAAMESRFAMPGGPKFSRSRIKIYGNTIIQTYRVAVKGPDGKRRKTKGLDVYKVKEGLLIRKDAYWKAIT